MKDRDDIDRLKDIKVAIKKIERYTKEISLHDFENNDLIQDAVIKNLEIIGEAAYKVSKRTKEKYSELEWRKIEGLRHKLVHDYYEINLEIIWNTKEKKLPELYKSANRLIKKIQRL